MKKRVKKAAALFLFLLTLVWVAQKVSFVLSNKDSVIKYGDFGDDVFDVLFFGTSHVINGVYPMELWDEYGIVSYNCAGHGNTLPASYYMLRNVLEDKRPSLVVIDVHLVWLEEKVREGRASVDQQHISFDWSPLSLQKWKMASDLFRDRDTVAEFLFPLTIYHERWKELGQGDFEIPYNQGKGAEYRVRRCDPDTFCLIGREEKNTGETQGVRYLRRMIEACKKEGIEVLLTAVPYPACREEQMWINGVQDIAKEYGIGFLNLFYEDTGVDFKTDCYDGNAHLNPSGARHVTRFLGKYLREQFGIPDRRGQDAYKDWEQDYQEYTWFKWNQLKWTKWDGEAYFTLLQDRNIDVCLFFRGDSMMLQEPVWQDLVKNLGPLPRFGEAVVNKRDYLAVIDQKSGEIQEFVGEQKADGLRTSFADISYTGQTLQPDRALYLNGEETNYLLNEDGTMAEIAVISFDKKSGERIDFTRINREFEEVGR